MATPRAQGTVVAKIIVNAMIMTTQKRAEQSPSMSVAHQFSLLPTSFTEINTGPNNYTCPFEHDNDNDNDTLREVPHPSNKGVALQARVQGS